AVQLGESSEHSQAAARGAARAIVERNRRAEDRADPVADELVERPLVAKDLVDHLAEVFVEKSDDILRGQRLRDRREAADVGEENGRFFLAAAERERGGIARDAIDEWSREKARERVALPHLLENRSELRAR